MVARSTDWPERRRRFTVLVVAFLIGPAIVAASVTAGGLFLVGGPIVAAALLFAFVASTRRRRDRAHVSKGLVRTAATSAPDRRIEAFFDVLERTSIQTLRMLAVRPLDRPAQEEAHRVGRIAAERSGLIGLAEDAAPRVTLG